MGNIIAWIVLGLIAGVIARAIYPGRQGLGIVGTMLLGVVGAFVGGFLHSLIGGSGVTNDLNFISIVVAVFGAIVTLFVYYAVTKRSA